VSLQAAMDKAAATRSLNVLAISEAASKFNLHAADVADAARAAGKNADERMVASKAAIYQKLVTAEVARSLALKQRATATSAVASATFHPEVIEIPSGVELLRAPPAHLLRRLTFVPQTLIATSAARHLRALMRRQTRQNIMQQAAINRCARAAAVMGRLKLREACRAAKIRAKEARARTMVRMKERNAAQLTARNMALATMVEANRLAADEEAAANGHAYVLRCERADELREAKMRSVAKRGVVAVRAAAFASRRAACDGAVRLAAQTQAKRRELADARHEAFLEDRIATAIRSRTLRQSPAEFFPNAIE